MCNRILTISLAIAGYLMCNAQPLPAQEPQFTVQVLATIDYPGSGNSTTLQGINDLGDVTGYFEDGTGATRSFIRYADGSFSAPIVEPNDVGNLTVAKDIDNTGRICGYYIDAHRYAPYRGFFLADSIFTEYGDGELTNWYINGITDAGIFCGTSVFYSEGPGCFLIFPGVGQVAWNIQRSSECNAINIDATTAGDYEDVFGVWHGFIRETIFPAWRILGPFDYPGASGTFLYGLNDGGRVIVGKYVDSVGITHGLIFQRPANYRSFDYPQAIETSLNGINNHKLVSGHYADSSGIRHGLIGRVQELARH